LRITVWTDDARDTEPDNMPQAITVTTPRVGGKIVVPAPAAQ
jgi:hypothetical protein